MKLKSPLYDHFSRLDSNSNRWESVKFRWVKESFYCKLINLFRSNHNLSLWVERCGSAAVTLSAFQNAGTVCVQSATKIANGNCFNLFKQKISKIDFAAPSIFYRCVPISTRLFSECQWVIRKPLMEFVGHHFSWSCLVFYRIQIITKGESS